MTAPVDLMPLGQGETDLTGLHELTAGLAALDDALPDYEEAERYYEGHVAEVFSSARIRRAIARTGQRYRFRLAKTPVRVLADRVKVAGVTVAGDQATTGLLAEIREANGMDVVEPETLLRCFEYGDAYAIVWPYDDEPGSDDDPLAGVGVEISYNSPKCVRVVYDERNPRRKAFAVKRWPERDPLGRLVWRVDVFFRDRVERWVSEDHQPEATTGQGVWLPYDWDGQDPVLDNPYGQIPVFHFRTAMPYGTPAHADAYGPQDAINKLLITQLTTTDGHGWPQRYRLTDKGAELDNAGDDPDWDDDDDGPGVSTLGGVSSSLRSGPGTVQDFTGTRAVGQFDAADPKVFLDPTDLYVRLMAQVTGTPFHYFDPTGDQPSGESLKTANAPLDASADRMQTILAHEFAAMYRFALRVAGAAVDKPVEIAWAPPDVVTDKDWWETAQLKKSMGVPPRQILAEANYTAEQLDAWGISEQSEPAVQSAPVQDQKEGQEDDDDEQ